MKVERETYHRTDPLCGQKWLSGGLFLAITVGCCLVLQRNGLIGATLPLALIGVQLAPNLYGRYRSSGLPKAEVTLVEIFLLGAVILATALYLRSVSSTGSWLLTSYLASVTFAVALKLEPGG